MTKIQYTHENSPECETRRKEGRSSDGGMIKTSAFKT